MSRIKDVFFRNIEENIAPVIYFHQLEPEVAAQEVAEYIFTTRPASHGNRLGGIHEQMVSLLNQISIAIDEGHKLPASWRTKALWAWQQLNTARDAIKADPDFMEGINWRP